ncbi:MAG: HAD family hydrolase [Pseudomonadota bacterium]
MPLVKGVLFDIGGVLLQSANEEIRAVLARWVGGDPRPLRAIFVQEYPAVERGQMSEADLQRLIQERLGLPEPAPVEALAEAWRRGSRPVPAMFELARALKAHGLRVGLLSNTQHSHVAMMREMGFPAEFDPVIFSCEVNARKPEPEIYRLGVERIGLAPAETLFIDDLAANVEGARAVGLQAIHHQEPAATIAAVRALVGLPPV